jgi:hypothetical protein
LQWLNDDAVICNADEYRNYHPQFKEIATLHEKAYPEITAEYSKPWNDGLKSHCETRRFNYILETTFSSGHAMNQTIADLKAKGYLVYLMLIAIPEPISLMGTYFRFEDAKKKKGYGRLVGKSEHDKRYNSLPETLKIVQEAKLYNELFIFARQFRVLNNSNQQAKVALKSRNPADPLSTYLKLRDKTPNVIEKRNYRKNYELIIRLMQERKAMTDELERFKFEVPPVYCIT